MRLRQYLAGRRLTLEQFSALSKIHPSTMSRYLSREVEPTASALLRMHKAIGGDFSALQLLEEFGRAKRRSRLAKPHTDGEAAA